MFRSKGDSPSSVKLTKIMLAVTLIRTRIPISPHRTKRLQVSTLVVLWLLGALNGCSPVTIGDNPRKIPVSAMGYNIILDGKFGISRANRMVWASPGTYTFITFAGDIPLFPICRGTIVLPKGLEYLLPVEYLVAIEKFNSTPIINYSPSVHSIGKESLPNPTGLLAPEQLPRVSGVCR